MNRFFRSLLQVCYLPILIVYGIAAILYGIALLFPIERPIKAPRPLRRLLNIRFNP